MVAGLDTLRARRTLAEDIDIGELMRSRAVARITMKALGRQIAAAQVDPEDIIGAVVVRLLEAQLSPRARFDPSRGYSPTTYVWMVARSAGLNELRRLANSRKHETRLAEEVRHDPPTVRLEEDEEAALDRILDLLDLDEERMLAWMMAEGHTLEEVREWLGLSRSEALELQTRVRALLMPLREG